MPWRSPFTEPNTFSSPESLRTERKLRAYRVWISEIMLQQTRVETVKSYYNAWMEKYPTIEALALAPEEDVLSSWRGLGYYSRATRIHTAAKLVVSHPVYQGLLPERPEELEKNVPGVGPYTAGAISSIVFGHAVPILDGNVARVLSRQLGLYANPKAKQTTDLLWAAARSLVEKAWEVGGREGRVAGEWNQALMELGSTVCTPVKAGCGGCPIRGSCRAFAEGSADLGKGKGKQEAKVVDIEDLCTFCEPFPSVEEEAQEEVTKAQEKGMKKLRQATLSFGFSASKTNGKAKEGEVEEKVQKHVQKFPMKLEKQKIRQEECLVLIIVSSQGYLLEQRPPTGLLASMWQFPSLTLSTTPAGPTSETQQLFPNNPVPALIKMHLSSLLPNPTVGKEEKVGSITHIFSHLNLTMHVYKVVLSDDADTAISGLEKKRKKAEEEGGGEKNRNFGSKFGDKAPRRWASAQEVEAETMGTGMRNCWLALQSHDQQPTVVTKSVKGGKGKK